MPKKVTRMSNETVDDNQKVPEIDKKPAVLSRQSSMEDQDSSDEKVQNLKSLNAILLKQTMETRHHIESLVQAKEELETELARYGVEKTDLLDEVDQASNVNLGLNLELDLVMEIVRNRFKEIGVGVDRLMMEKSDLEREITVLKGETEELMSKVEIDKEELRKVCDERDSFKNGFDLQSEEVNRLKEIVIRLEEKESNLETVIEKLNSGNERLLKEMRLREEVIEVVNKEKIDLEKTIEEKKKEIDGMKGEIEMLLIAKNEMEIVKIDQRKIIEELEKKLDKLNETVQRLTKEDRVLRDLVSRLKNDLDESMEKERAMTVQIDSLGKEKESELQRLMKEKVLGEKQIEMLSVQSSEKENLINQLSREKIELEELVCSQEAKLVELNQKTNAVDELQKKCNDLVKTNHKLSCEVSKLSDALAQVALKKVEADMALDEEKRYGDDLKAEVIKSEKMIEKTRENLEKIKIERESLLSAKNRLESQSESLKVEKSILEKEIVELKKAMDVLKTELESVGMDAKQSLVMLKSAANILSQSKNQEDNNFITEQQKQENRTESYAVELESIEKAFKTKENMIKELKKEAETMKQSKEEADKKQSFWAFVSSVTTVLAAASFAYASRKR